MYVMITYDIKDDKMRMKVMNRLLALGFTRLQKSVYVRRGSRGDAKDALRAVQNHLREGDKLFIIVVSEKEFKEAIRVEREAA